MTIVTAQARKSRIATTGWWLRTNAAFVLASAILLLVLAWAVVPGLFTGDDPLTIDQSQRLLSPSADHWFGTDLLGRDVYARIVYGARASIAGAALAVGVGVFVGSALGAFAGWFGGFADNVVMRAIDVILSIPSFLLAIAIVVIYTAGTDEAGLVPAALAVGLTSAATFARLIRSEIMSVRVSSYVEAAVTSGASTWSILRRHVVPNSIGPTVALVTVQFGVAIIWIASLSFLGLGAQPPEPEWGLMVSDGRDFIATREWLIIVPAVTISVVVLAANQFSRHLQKRSIS
ncbi:ABC transporter permease [Gordonia sp. MP11Mi]|uniref:D,D-dipeptide transport system permease protein DdpC n=1 Tax=Gordonia sp. MP11Mi TaxID=3022769 RepID=A0AA97GTB8_9ACTN